MSNENLHEALCRARSQFETVVKNRKGVHGSRYADIFEVIDKSYKHLSSEKISCVTVFRHNPGGANPETGLVVEPLTTIVTTVTHAPSNQSVESELPIEVNFKDLMGFGKNATYLRRYQIVALLYLAAEDAENISSGAEKSKGRTLVPNGKVSAAEPLTATIDSQSATPPPEPTYTAWREDTVARSGKWSERTWGELERAARDSEEHGYLLWLKDKKEVTGNTLRKALFCLWTIEHGRANSAASDQPL
ncbi:MAG: hypothetical protein CL793_07480 [Chloroflexi bacterium]|nr:hypothetical protein [Chloroflexota bacterium]